jgi:hypothetical protein
MAARRPPIRYALQTFRQSRTPRRTAANPAMLARMSKRKASAPKAERRPRSEIDRNYFFGDLLIKTGVALALVVVMIAAYTPITLRSALAEHMYDYLAVMGVFAAIALGCYLLGRHLRREATHWDFD